MEAHPGAVESRTGYVEPSEGLSWSKFALQRRRLTLLAVEAHPGILGHQYATKNDLKKFAITLQKFNFYF